MTVAVCPKCGFDLEVLHAIELGELKIEYDGAIILWKGKRLALSAPERLMLLAMIENVRSVGLRWRMP